MVEVMAIDGARKRPGDDRYQDRFGGLPEAWKS
jgi:hypothetical protein